jgi:hypothetical protein
MNNFTYFHDIYTMYLLEPIFLKNLKNITILLERFYLSL